MSRSISWRALGVGVLLMLLVGLSLTARGNSARPPVSAPKVVLTPTASELPAVTPLGSLWEITPTVVVITATWQAESLTVRFQVGQIPGDYLFETPVLQLGDRPYPPTPASVQAARRVLLDLAGWGAGKADLVFPNLPETGAGTLVFNPGATAANLVSPRVEVAVNWTK